jgi:hypothetical protein
MIQHSQIHVYNLKVQRRNPMNAVLKTMMGTCVALSCAMSPVFAQTTGELSGAELRQLVNGKTVFLAAPLGGEFPLNYKTDGSVTGDGAAVGLGRFFAARETGRWFMTGNQLCQQFPTWYSGQRLCFNVARLPNNRIRWTRDNGETGIARLGQ